MQDDLNCEREGKTELFRLLQQDDLISPGRAVLTPLAGGVSSEVWLVESAGRVPFVAKRCLPKLRVEAEWFADPARLRHEYWYLKSVAGFLPEAVPKLISENPDGPYLAMEFLGAGFENWKRLLLAGKCDPRDAGRAGSILGRIHAATRCQPEIWAHFDTLEFFIQLRIDAYLRFTALRHPGPVGAALSREAERLEHHAECLVHGDYSPKNMLSSKDRFVVLDCETACVGDPAFDLAFLLNHLCLKGLYHAPSDRGLCALVSAAVAGYKEADPHHAAEVCSRAATLLPMLQLARVDGKSPVEYLAPRQRQSVRDFARARIARGDQTLEGVLFHWFDFISSLSVLSAK